MVPSADWACPHALQGSGTITGEKEGLLEGTLNLLLLHNLYIYIYTYLFIYVFIPYIAPLYLSSP